MKKYEFGRNLLILQSPGIIKLSPALETMWLICIIFWKPTGQDRYH